MEEQIKNAREYFSANKSHVHIRQIDDSIIAELLEREYIKKLSFEMQMDCLYDYLISQGLCDVTE